MLTIAISLLTNLWMKKMSNRAFYYIVQYFMALVIFFMILCSLLGAVMLLLMFITWSLPVASPFTWWVFRIILTLSFVISSFYIFSPQAKDWVNGCLEDTK